MKNKTLDKAHKLATDNHLYELRAFVRNNQNTKFREMLKIYVLAVMIKSVENDILLDSIAKEI